MTNKAIVKTGKAMLELITELTPLNRVFCSKDYDRAVECLKKHLPFEVHGYTAKDERNGWVIPPRSDVKEAKIVRKGEVIYDGLEHPLRVISLSAPFKGMLELGELKRHLYYHPRLSNAIPYHFRQQYRSWQRDWGFCVTKKFFEALEPGKYEVLIKTEEAPGTLKVLSYTHPGKLPETFVFVAHLDHPGMANDDAAGCAVGVGLFKYLAGRGTKFSYQLLLVPEIMGSEYYLGQTVGTKRGRILESVFLEMLGTQTPLALQQSLKGTSMFEKAILQVLVEMQIPYRVGAFKSVIGNDESIWETYGIPMASLSRFPYPEYHTDLDNLSIISERALTEALEVLERAVEELESSRLIVKKFKGNLCVSNPKYGLYIDAGQTGFGTDGDEVLKKMRLLMDVIPTLHEPTTVRFLAQNLELDEKQVTEYLESWVEKGLLELR